MLLKDRFTILIVDDSEVDRDTYRRYLEHDRTTEFDIHVACYASEGLEFCQTTWPDAILLDFLLPDRNGIAFIEALQVQARGRDLPAILVLTGQGNEEIAVTLMKQGVQDYVVKNKLTESNLQSLVQRILDRVKAQRSLQIQQQWQQILAEVALNIRRSLDLPAILNTAVTEIKQFLQCDRVVIYQFTPEWVGHVVAEAVAPQYTPALGAEIVDTCFVESRGRLYQQGRQTAIDDIYHAEIAPCHLAVLERFQVRALAVVPILLAPEQPTDELPRLWGLAIAHQCECARIWTESVLLFLDRLSVQLAIAIQQAELLARVNGELERRTIAEEALRLQSITQQQWLQELAITTALLKQRNTDLDSFVSSASHDLRAPLRAIRNLATWLAEDLTGTIDRNSQQQFDLLTSRVRQMEALLDDLLDYAQLGRKPSRIAPISLTALLHDIARGIDIPPTFTVIFPPDLPTIATNATALEQVLTNLIANAVKHHHCPDGTVEINFALQSPDLGIFEVIDDGPGIPPEYHQKMFEIFKTFSRIKTADSTGIGLAIVKKILELQGGTITLESQLDRGTKFTFTWPLVAPIDPSGSELRTGNRE